MNYTELQDNIAGVLGRSDLSDEIINAISQVETELSLSLRTSELEVQNTLTQASETYTLPDDYQEMKRVQVNGLDVEQMTPEVADTATSTPVGYYFIGQELIIKIVPDPLDLVLITYYKRVPQLSDSASSNDLLTRYPTLYINGALFYMKLLVQDLEEAQIYSERFNSLIAALNSLHARRRGKARLSTPYVLGQGYTPAV